VKISAYLLAWSTWIVVYLQNKQTQNTMKTKRCIYCNKLVSENDVCECNIIEEYNEDGYLIDEEGNIISCCGDIVDPDHMICPTCNEHQ